MEMLLVDLFERRIAPVRLHIAEGKIARIEPLDEAPASAGYLAPGFTDAHVHIESSMLPPAEFARMAVVHGTIATVSDPHEIANVLGEAGVRYMLDNAATSPFKFCFGAPSCVPATAFETAGAQIDAEAVQRLLADERIGYLSEMMNFPGVLNREAEVMAKIEAAHSLGKPVDGHAPGLRGADAERYFSVGISTDHECFTYEEALEKAQMGVHILIREGSAARNFEALWPLIRAFPAQVMFCSDDKHPDDLLGGHINQLVARAVAKGCDVFDALRAACVNPVLHYRLGNGLLREGDPADFVVLDNLTDFTVRSTWINGEKVAENGISLLPYQSAATPNHWRIHPLLPEQFAIPAPFSYLMEDVSAAFPVLSVGRTIPVRAIGARDGQIVTDHLVDHASISNGQLLPDAARDLLLIAVVNRYQPDTPPALGFVRGFGLRQGALASSVAHDSHNIVAVGVSAQAVCAAVNAVVKAGGGIAAVNQAGEGRVLRLPIAGLMSPENGYDLAQQYQDLDRWVKENLGAAPAAPFMLLSFLALPVIPSLKMTDLGLFDVEKFDFTDIVASE